MSDGGTSGFRGRPRRRFGGATRALDAAPRASGARARAAGGLSVDLDDDRVAQQAVQQGGGDHVVADGVDPLSWTHRE